MSENTSAPTPESKIAPEGGNTKLVLTVLSLVGVAIMVLLVVTYAGQVSVLYLKADQVFSRLKKEAISPASAATKKTSLVGRFFRIHGKLKSKSTRRLQGRLDWEFHVQGKSGKSMLVKYTGILPDTFRDGAELVLEGQLVTPTLFRATKVFAKCPTKYKEDKVKQKKPTT